MFVDIMVLVILCLAVAFGVFLILKGGNDWQARAEKAEGEVKVWQRRASEEADGHARAEIAFADSRDNEAKLTADLATERARKEWCIQALLQCGVVPHTLNNAAIDAARRENDAKG